MTKKKLIEIELPEGFEETMVKTENGYLIEVKPIKENKEKEMKDFLLSFINGSTIYLDLENYPGYVFYNDKNNQILFHYNIKNLNLWVNYHKIWSIFENKYGLKYGEIQLFIKTVVEDSLNLNVVAPNAGTALPVDYN